MIGRQQRDQLSIYEDQGLSWQSVKTGLGQCGSKDHCHKNDQLLAFPLSAA